MHRILIVEPSENVATTLRAVLEEHDFAVDVVEHARDVELASLGAYAVLIVDVRLEDRSGFALLDRVHHDAAHLAGRVVVISADDSEVVTRELDLLGVCGIVPKPIHSEEIVRAVFECLGSDPV